MRFLKYLLVFCLCTPSFGVPFFCKLPNSSSDMEKIESMMEAWNLSGNIDWSEYRDYPHPTFRLGTREAYQQSAKQLLSFLTTADSELLKTARTFCVIDSLNGVRGTFKHLAKVFAPYLEGNERSLLIKYSERHVD